MNNTLMSLKDQIPELVIDLKYATNDNIAGRKLYDGDEPKLLTPLVPALRQIQQQLFSSGYKLVIWDAYRPSRVQEILRQYCDDDKYVATISNHSKGIAVDVTLAEANTGHYLDMGTDFDEFSFKAHADFDQLTDVQKQNRQILKNIMESVSFNQLDTEWWHFDYLPLINSEVLDLDWSKAGA
jgi:D-alanyl-D-alanine dipeptidase